MARKSKKPKRTRPRGATGRRQPTGVQLGEDVARNRVLLGATQVFATKGFRDASVEDLLQAAQVSRRTFYRFFKGKHDVALVLYTVGTNGLLDSCQRAIASETDVLVQLEKCIDIHLGNARRMGRLVYTLGGEAQSLESPLYQRRIEVHDQLVEMFVEASETARSVDPLFIRVLVVALEQVTRMALEISDMGRRVSDRSFARARAVMMRVATAAVEGTGPRVTPMPALDAALPRKDEPPHK